VIERVRKLFDKPLDAPSIPANRHTVFIRTFTPNRSLRIPPNKLIRIPARLVIPQTVPICTRLKPNSSEISLKRGGMQEIEIVATKAAVVTVSTKMNHR
jgi:hypothetical protein